MGILQWIDGTITVELTSADIGGFLFAAQLEKTEINNIEITGPFSVSFRISRRSYSWFQALAEKRGEKLEIKKKVGLFWPILRLRKRPILVAGIVFIFLLSVWAPGRVFFIRVEGNQTVPERRIMECAAGCGISFGASRRQVRSEKMKNALLDKMPELSWAGVNTYGCTAVISVRERSDPQIQGQSNTVSSIVASRDGVIQQITVVQGNKLCAVGQAVKQGQVLISGYTDCGISIQATNAKGEVFAHTNRQIAVICPSEFVFRGETTAFERKYSLIIGNKRINFSNSSGISGTGCAKIYEENYIVLPGGFQLPLAVCVETWYFHDKQEIVRDTAREMLSAFSRNYLLEHMCAGSIYMANEQFSQDDGILMLQGSYSCLEMIGIARLEENLLDYVKND